MQSSFLAWLPQSLIALVIPIVVVAMILPAQGADPRIGRQLDALVAAYPDHLAGHTGHELVWKDGMRMPVDDGITSKSAENFFDHPDIEDQFRFDYHLGAGGLPPDVDDDPGRVRFEPLFRKMYGDCRKDEVFPRLVDVAWLPARGGGTIRVTTVNGVDKALARVSAELDTLPDHFTKFLIPSSGAYNCRAIAGTERLSMHAFGAAIDLNSDETTYWRWEKPSAGGYYFWQNNVPLEIVRIFEKHGFIWGGKWYHYDTMHFEYRPELIGLAQPETIQ